MHTRTLLQAIALGSSLLCGLVMVACTDDPVYVQSDTDLEAGGPNADPDIPATAQILLPIRIETDEEAEDRAALAEELGMEIPYVTLGDLELSLEWTITNQEDSDATVRIQLNGANEYFAYVPASFVVDPEEEEEPPPLAGNIPLVVPAEGSLSGVFREDQLHEAAIDLELITRGAINPFAAMLERHEDLTEIAVVGAPAIPRAAMANLIRLDFVLVSNRHVVMEYAVRVRSHRDPNLVHEKGLDALAGELVVFAPADFVPPPPPPTP